jgi:hypothetical protein
LEQAQGVVAMVAVRPPAGRTAGCHPDPSALTNVSDEKSLHTYQRSTVERRANQPSPRPDDTVGAAGMG